MSKGSFEENLIVKLGREYFNKVQSSSIGIAGAGGLGSNCAALLVRSGFVKLTIVDFDFVEMSNLDRQFYFHDQIGMPKVEALANNLIRINPRLELHMVQVKIENSNVAEFFNQCTVVAECLDRAEYKSILVESLLARKIFTVAASGLGGIGRSDEITTRRINDTLIMVGDRVSDISSKPAVAPRVNVAAAKQADAILEYVVNSVTAQLPNSL
jgi:thiamine biosynthesis protein ThiF, family 2